MTVVQRALGYRAGHPKKIIQLKSVNKNIYVIYMFVYISRDMFVHLSY